MKSFSSAGIAGVFLAALIAIAGCEPKSSDGTKQGQSGIDISQPDIPFERHGSLSFRRDDQRIVEIDIEIADDDSSRTRGLMQRSGLPDRSGMLFIFPGADYQSFWMANTQISLDILFVTSDSTVAEIHKYTRPLSPRNIGGTALFRFVVEVPAGFVDNYGIVEGDRVRWTRD